jgi:RNA polymerase sigma-70 factor (ECF subfamily)
MVRLVRRPSSSKDELRPLAEAAAAGDPGAMRTLLVTLVPELLRVVRRLLGAGHPEVEDVTQESAVALVGALSRFRGESSTRHFAARVALHTSMVARRRMVARKRALPASSALVDADDAEGDEPGPEARAATSAKAAVVRALCDELPPPQAEALALHVVLGYTVHEAAALLGVPVETFRSRLRLGKLALRDRALGRPELAEQQEESA